MGGEVVVSKRVALLASQVRRGEAVEKVECGRGVTHLDKIGGCSPTPEQLQSTIAKELEQSGAGAPLYGWESAATVIKYSNLYQFNIIWIAFDTTRVFHACCTNAALGCEDL